MAKTEKSEIIGERLVKLRGERARTKVARKLGIGYSSLCNYEKGNRVPPDDVKERIADYYSVSVQELFFTF